MTDPTAPQPPQPRDELDHLLSRARWPAPSLEAEKRLRSLLLQRKEAEPAKWRARAWSIGSIAAAIVIGLFLVRQPARTQHSANRIATSVPPSPVLPPIIAPVFQLPVRSLQLSDRLALIEVSFAKSSKAPLAPAPPLPPAISNRVFVPSLAQLRTALWHPDQWDSVPQLLKQADVRTLQELTFEKLPIQWQSRIVPELLDRGTDGLSAVLQMLSDPARRSLAKAALLDHPIAEDDLIRQFSNPLVQTRLAAAYELGHNCNGQTTGHLIEMAQRRDHPGEAIAALFLCHDPKAKAFIASNAPVQLIGMPSQPLSAQLRRQMSTFD